MKLQAKLRLALSKQRKVIEIKYNTFEKATYDKFLCASLAKRARSKEEAYTYIDDITGQGSLNSHFKMLYDEAKTLGGDQLDAIMASSMYPILKIDSSAWYDYFEEFGISLYKNKIFIGDLENYSIEAIAQIVGVNETILEKRVITQRNDKRPQPYDVIIEDNKISVKIGTDYLDIRQDLFENVVVKELDRIDGYKGDIVLSPEGEGWQMLTNASLNPLLSGNRFYYENGNHFLIRASDVRQTIVSKFAGLYFFKQNTMSYKYNPELSKKVIDFLVANEEIKTFKASDIIAILDNTDGVRKRDVINYFLERRDSADYAKYGLKVLMAGVEIGWTKSALKAFLKYANNVQEIETIYRIDSTIGFDIKQLVGMDKTILTENHRALVEEYNNNLEKKRVLIKGIIGEVTSKGLRERSKELVSDENTKKFSKLCNKLIGHVDKDIDKADLEELEEWQKDAYELLELSKLIEEKLSK